MLRFLFSSLRRQKLPCVVFIFFLIHLSDISTFRLLFHIRCCEYPSVSSRGLLNVKVKPSLTFETFTIIYNNLRLRDVLYSQVLRKTVQTAILSPFLLLGFHFCSLIRFDILPLRKGKKFGSLYMHILEFVLTLLNLYRPNIIEG